MTPQFLSSQSPKIHRLPIEARASQNLPVIRHHPCSVGVTGEASLGSASQDATHSFSFRRSEASLGCQPRGNSTVFSVLDPKKKLLLLYYCWWKLV
jgi:hypothetical protein